MSAAVHVQLCAILLEAGVPTDIAAEVTAMDVPEQTALISTLLLLSQAKSRKLENIEEKLRNIEGKLDALSVNTLKKADEAINKAEANLRRVT